MLNDGLEHFSSVVKRVTGKDVSDIPGAGAAGGLGGGFVAFLHARLERGIEMVLDAISFDERIRGASLIITGEGRVDFQTLTGKTPYGILKRARRQGIPVVAIGGSVALGEKEASEAGFAGVYAVTPSDMPLEEAMKPETAVRNIYDTVKNILNHE